MPASNRAGFELRVMAIPPEPWRGDARQPTMTQLAGAARQNITVSCPKPKPVAVRQQAFSGRPRG